MIIQPMTSDRFEAIIEAYGANPNRWPEAEREAGRAFMQREPQLARALMSDARGVDALLGRLSAPEPSDALQWEILARLMPAGVVEKVAENAGVIAFTPRAAKTKTLWGLGLAAACAAGVIFGVNLGLASTSEVRADEILASASLTDASVSEGDNW